MLQHLDRLSSIESLELPEGIDRTIHQNRLVKLAREGRKGWEHFNLTGDYIGKSNRLPVSFVG